jgi:hypothetical protein
MKTTITKTPPTPLAAVIDWHALKFSEPGIFAVQGYGDHVRILKLNDRDLFVTNTISGEFNRITSEVWAANVFTRVAESLTVTFSAR